MIDTRPPDCRPLRRDESATCTSAHPELIVGEFVMRPRIRAALAAEDRATVSRWSVGMISAWVLVVAGVMSY
jgi:hypothetical protein